jgi:hypothetical protein
VQRCLSQKPSDSDAALGMEFAVGQGPVLLRFTYRFTYRLRDGQKFYMAPVVSSCAEKDSLKISYVV